MAEVFSAADLDRLHAVADVVWGRDDPMALEEARRALEDATAVVSAGWRYGTLPSRTPNLRAIIDIAGGLPSGLDYDDCYQRRIRVLTAAPGFGRQVAEFALGLALAASREIVLGDRLMREGREQWLHAGNETTFLLYEQPVGMIGYGNIARCLRTLLEPFRCRLSAYDPWLADGYLRSLGVEPMPLEALVRNSQVIFVLAAPTSENQALLGRDMLELIRPGAVLVLASRAHVVDFNALTELVVDGRFKAAIDVFPDEPPALDHPIRTAAGAVLSAHRAGSVKEGLWDLGQMVVDDLEAIVRGLPPQRLQVAAPELIGRLTTK
jgi:phosphoglycerate dehydrogenase-like enzyme